jgi:tetratricopeptide (TPR) repeat protein
LAIAPDRRDETQRHAIETLGTSLQGLADIQRRQGDPTCAATFREALCLAEAINNTVAQAIYAFNLGHVYKQIASLRNHDEAERWYRKSLDLHAPDDRLGRGRCIGQLGQVAYARFQDALTNERPVEELAHHIAEAGRLSEQALNMMPATAVVDRGTIHNQLGTIYHIAGDIDRALHHFQQAIRICEQTRDIFYAGQTRHNAAVALLAAGRLSDALAYAEAALTNFRTFSDRALADIQETERLIDAIDEAIAAKGGGT